MYTFHKIIYIYICIYIIVLHDVLQYIIRLNILFDY